MHLDSHQGKDLCEHLQTHCYADREDLELIVMVPYQKMEKLAAGRENVHVEAGILHVESCEPGSLGEGWDNQCQCHHTEFELSHIGV